MIKYIVLRTLHFNIYEDNNKSVKWNAILKNKKQKNVK